MNSEDIALGWATLVSDLIENGRLFQVGAHRLVIEDRYHILTPAGRAPSAATVTLLNWLAAAFETSQRRLFNASQG